MNFLLFLQYATIWRDESGVIRRWDESERRIGENEREKKQGASHL